MHAAKAYAYIQGRSYVVPDDVQYLAPHVLAHRMLVTPEARYAGQKSTDILQQLIQKMHIPVQKEYHHET